MCLDLRPSDRLGSQARLPGSKYRRRPRKDAENSVPTDILRRGLPPPPRAEIDGGYTQSSVRL